MVIDLDHPPPVVKPPKDQGPPVSLHWERAIDDERRLRHCLVCGCQDMYVRRSALQLTGFALIIVAAIVAMVLYGFYTQLMWALAALCAVLVIDAVILWNRRRALVCYRCGSRYFDVLIPPQRRAWESALAERYRGDADPASRAVQHPPHSGAATHGEHPP